MTSHEDLTIDTPVAIRRARVEDLVQAARIKAADDTAASGRFHPLASPTPPDAEITIRTLTSTLAMLVTENPDQVWVADNGATVVGMTSAAFRGQHAQIQNLFVAPEQHHRGIGTRLLSALMDAGRATGCTAFSLQASDDPRAIALYLKRGFRPVPPSVYWSVAETRLHHVTFDNPFEAVPIAGDDLATLNTVGDIDKAVRGAKRQGDLARWLLEGAFGSLLLCRETGTPVGYFLAGARRGLLRIGPVAAIDEALFPSVLAMAFAASARCEPGTGWSMVLPGENRRAVDSLLSVGFRPHFLLPILSTAPVGQFDRYAFRDLDFL